MSYSSTLLATLLPGTNIKIIGSKVTGSGCAEGFYKITTDNNVTGYVCSKFVLTKEEMTKIDNEYTKYLMSLGFDKITLQGIPMSLLSAMRFLRRYRTIGNRSASKARLCQKNHIPPISLRERYSVRIAAGVSTGSGRSAKKGRIFTGFIALPTAG